ncbi:MAG: polysialic acid transporter [Deltaproteobacteria bacterium RIFCSPLOWO2_02_FULL_53_8]|nr:MAG: polysialic acid transporter [Deltaproteobacteria bacterium RIFCSPLOWO2_02_FULL_53_8]
MTSEVFGANLFTGAFAKEGPGRFNPDYAIMVGDRIQLRLWGGFEFEGIVEVDPKGNIFLPHVGPVQILGARNDDLQKTVETAVRRIFRANVYSYASLAAAQPVRVFVGGFVSRPGLYNGTSMDSLLSYLDQAGGIDTERGSFLSVQVKRGDRIRATVNLYDFLLQGRIPLVQLAEGDVIFVLPRQSTVKVSGLVANAKRFEFSSERRTVADLIRVAKPKPSSTHVRVVRNSGDVTNTEYFPISQASQIELMNGDELDFTADKKPGTITVRVEGEHLSAQEYVLPYGARLGELMGNIQYSERSDSEKPQLFRLSVKERQKQMLAVSLKTLESTVLSARSGTNTEATLRTEEANLIMNWVERAKQIEPGGQVVISKSEQRNDLLLENGDIIRIHAKDGLVLIGGEVLFPNAVAFDKKYDLDQYIKVAGGYTQNADTSRIIVAHRDGSFEEGKRADIVAGDEVLVLPKVDVKSREIAKDLMQMVYQIAIAARVVIGL